MGRILVPFMPEPRLIRTKLPLKYKRIYLIFGVETGAGAGVGVGAGTPEVVVVVVVGVGVELEVEVEVEVEVAEVGGGGVVVEGEVPFVVGEVVAVWLPSANIILAKPLSLFIHLLVECILEISA